MLLFCCCFCYTKFSSFSHTCLLDDGCFSLSFLFFLSRIFDKKQNKVEVDMQCNKNKTFFRKKLSQVLAIFSFPVHKVFGLVTKPNLLTPKCVLKRQKLLNYKMTIMPKCFGLKTKTYCVVLQNKKQ